MEVPGVIDSLGYVQRIAARRNGLRTRSICICIYVYVYQVSSMSPHKQRT